MASKVLTDAGIKNKKVANGEKLLYAAECLYVRVRPTGKDWLFIYSQDKRRRKMGLGTYPELTLEEARERATGLRKQVAAGIDPVAARDAQEAQRKAAEAASAARHTISTLFEEWHRKEASKRQDEGAEIRRAFDKDVLPVIGSMYADEVRRRHILQILDSVKERNANRIANLLLQYLRQMFRFAALREIVPGDPTFGLNKRNVGGEELERDRHFDQDEIRELAGKLPDAGLARAAETAIWIMLSTCCRVGEISRAQWQDVDLEAGTWTIPADHAKNGREHLIHLSDFARRQFETLREIASHDRWVYPSHKGDTHVCTKSLQKQFYDRQRSTRLTGRSKKTATLCLTGGQWRAHDLRRSGATLMGELGVRSDVIERCLNHVGDDKLRKTYQHQELMGEREVAFRLLGERLELLARGDQVGTNVVPLRVKAA